MAIIPKGKEPASIKKRLDILFPKLNQAYPDKKISGLYKEHKKWAETVTELYRALGYPDGTSFLEAYRLYGSNQQRRKTHNNRSGYSYTESYGKVS